MGTKLPRGISNANPGNIRKSATKWQGMAEQQPDQSFVTFTTPQFGIRAMARILIRYQDEHDLNTVRGVIGRWAPPVENETDAYVDSVCKHTGFDADQPLNMQSYDDLMPLVKAIIWHENGKQPYPQAVIDDGLKMAGVVRVVKPSVAKDPKVIGATVVTVAATAQQVATNVSGVWQSLSEISPSLPNYLVMGLGAVAVLVVLGFAVEHLIRRSRGIA